MSTSEAAPALLGPRYAPDDPTLPQPWKGLIDGSTGVLYYWNPETNVTQYEKPAALPPPLPTGPPPTASTPTVAPVPGARIAQTSDVKSQPSHQLMQTSHQQVLPVNSLLQQQAQTPHQGGQPQSSQVASGGQQQGSLSVPNIPQQGQIRPQQFRSQVVQYIAQDMPSHLGQVPLHTGQQAAQQAMLQIPQAGHQNQSYQAVSGWNALGYQLAHQPTQYMHYQQNVPAEVPQSSQPQGHKVVQGQQFPEQRDQKFGYQQREDTDLHRGKQVGFSKTPEQQSSATNFVQASPLGAHPTQAMGFTGSANMHTSSLLATQHGEMEFVHQNHGPRLQSQVGPGIMHTQQPKPPSFGKKMDYEEGSFGRTGNDFYGNSRKDVHVMAPQHPKLAAIPMARTHQDARRADILVQGTIPSLPGAPNTGAGPPYHDMYAQAVAHSPFPNNAFTRPPPAIVGPSDPNLIHLSPIEIYRQTHEVTAMGNNVPPPFMTFETTGFPPEILREMHFAGFSAPTPIQAQTWSIAIQSRDIVAIAKTGSGKTLGYLIPAFLHLRQLRNNPLNGPTVLVLAPTRELATQIQDEAIKFGRSSSVTSTCLYGGASKGQQLKELERGADIVVATPGRLNDILDMKRIDLRQVSLLVLDEADRMLDMGFEPQIRKIVNELPPRRQTLMYTATWPKEVRKIAGDLLINPVQVNIGSVDELVANKSITQYVEVVPQMEKQRRLEQILRSQERGSKIIIFCSTKKLCDQLTRSISHHFGAAAIHGDKNQSERDWVLNQFRNGKTPILVATDVAARGLDIRDIRVVINYDFPTGIEDYVHRIGRTGRAGATGVSYTFFSDQDWKFAPDLIKILEGAKQNVPHELREMTLRGASNFGKDRGGMNRFESADGVSGRWDSGGRGGMRNGGFAGRGGMRDVGFSGRGGMRDGSFGHRGGFSGHGGMRDGNFGGRGGRDRGYGGRGGWERNDRGLSDRYNMDGRGRGWGRGRGRFDNRRDTGDRGRGRSYSRSPDKVRTWGYSRSRSISRSRSRNRSYSRSRSRSWSRSYSPRQSRSRSRSRSQSYERYERRPPRKTKFDQREVTEPNAEVPPESDMSHMPPDAQKNGFSGTEPPVQDPNPLVAGTDAGFHDSGADPNNLTAEA